jgi:peptide/nickel transport system substrate-binding protein
MQPRSTPVRSVVSVLLTLVTVISISIATTLSGSAEKAQAKGSGIPKRCATTIKAKGSITFSDWQFPASLNLNSNSQLVATYVANTMFDGLFLFDQHSHLIPQMATTVPTLKNGGITNKGRTITIHLKKGLLWSNGSEITMQDLKFGLAVGKDPLTGPACQGTCDVISRIDNPDKYTAVLHLASTYAPILAYGIPPIFPRKWNAGGHKWSTPHEAAQVIFQTPTFNYESAQYPTNGPYQVKQFVQDDRIVLTPMKYYNDMTCGARLKQLIFSFYSSKPGLIAAAANRQTDVTGGGGGYTPADLTELRKHTDAFKLHAVPSLTLEHLEFNVDPQYNGKTNPLSNTKVRQALALSLDKLGLIQSALGVSQKDATKVAAWSLLVNSPGLVQPFADKSVTGQWDPITRKYTSATGKGQALKDAKKLLSQTPFKGGFSLETLSTSGNPVRAAQLAVMQQNWKRLGVDLALQLLPSSALFGQWSENGPLHHGQFQVAMFGASGLPDPDQEKYNLAGRFIDRSAGVHGALNQNYSGIRDSVLDKAFKVGATNLVPRVRAKAYATMQERVNQQAYWIGLYYRPTIATTSPRVLSFLDNPTQEGPTWNVYNWKTKAS